MALPITCVGPEKWVTARCHSLTKTAQSICAVITGSFSIAGSHGPRCSQAIWKAFGAACFNVWASPGMVSAITASKSWEPKNLNVASSMGTWRTSITRSSVAGGRAAISVTSWPRAARWRVRYAAQLSVPPSGACSGVAVVKRTGVETKKASFMAEQRGWRRWRGREILPIPAPGHASCNGVRPAGSG